MYFSAEREKKNNISAGNTGGGNAVLFIFIIFIRWEPIRCKIHIAWFVWSANNRNRAPRLAVRWLPNHDRLALSTARTSLRLFIAVLYPSSRFFLQSTFNFRSGLTGRTGRSQHAYVWVDLRVVLDTMTDYRIYCIWLNTIYTIFHWSFETPAIN